MPWFLFTNTARISRKMFEPTYRIASSLAARSGFIFTYLSVSCESQVSPGCPYDRYQGRQEQKEPYLRTK